MSANCLHGCANEFAGRHNLRSLDTIDQMRLIARQLVGKGLKYKDLVE